MKVREVLRLLRDDGWYIKEIEGSHRQLKHLTKRGKVTVPGHPNDDLSPRLLANIERQSGLKLRGR